MFDLNLIEEDEAYEKIINLEGDQFNPYKVVALIHLDRYKEALKYVTKGTYEAAYIYYKLKNYKKALRIVSRFMDERGHILKSQILYAMGFYNKAYAHLRNIPKDDEIIINMQAMKSMAILTEKTNSTCGHKLWMKKKDELIEFDDLRNHRFTLDESRKEFIFNKTFEEAYDTKRFVEALRSATASFPSETDNILTRQLNNIEGTFDEIEVDNLNKTQKQIVLYNMQKTDIIDNSIHFLKNFSGKLSDSEWNWVLKAKLSDFKLNFFDIPPSSDNLRLLRIFVGLKNNTMFKKLALKEAESISNTTHKNIIRAYFEKNTVDSALTTGIMNLTI